MNSVSGIIAQCASRGVSFDQRVLLKELGPPRPNLVITQPQKECKSRKGFIRKFNKSMYDCAEWLCGCEVKNAFFCYYCLVMNATDSVWTVNGISDLKHLLVKVKKHKTSEKHINASIEYAVLGRVNIGCQLDSAYRLNIQKHNEEVAQNRYILNKLIDAVKFCGVFELALRGHNERDTSDNPGIFRGLINLMADLDGTLKQHIEKTKNRVFLGLSKTIQNDLLDSIYSVCHQLICEEISSTDFIAIQADETTDVATLSQLVFIVRYELNGKINERFISYVNPKSLNAEGISEAIFNELQNLGIDKTPDKVIAQSYDGTATMSGQHTGVQARVQAVYKNAHYVHCYAHQLNLIVERCATQNKQLKIFFSNFEAFSSFFSMSTKRTGVLDEVVKKRMPKNSATRWNFKSRIVSTLYNYKEEIYECLENIVDDNTNDYKAINKAIGLQNLIKNDDFNYWLDFFNKIMPHVDILYNELQHRSIDCIKARKYVDEFKSSVDKVRNSIPAGNTAGCSHDDDSSSGPKTKRARFVDRKDVVAKEICDVITVGVNDRFRFVDHLSVGILFEPTLFAKHKESFPESELETAVKLFGLNKLELRQELSVIYSRNDFSAAKGSLMLLNFIYDNNLTQVLPESVKLLKVICTIPMTNAESERCFSTLKRIKNFTRNTMRENRLNALAMCSIEKGLLKNPNFNELVIQHFSEEKDRRMNFCFKKLN